jgi:hypothetical protein
MSPSSTLNQTGRKSLFHPWTSKSLPVDEDFFFPSNTALTPKTQNLIKTVFEQPEDTLVPMMDIWDDATGSWRIQEVFDDIQISMPEAQQLPRSPLSLSSDPFSQFCSLSFYKHHMFFVVDMRNGESVNAWISTTVSRFGKHDGAVNIAGVLTKSKEVKELSDEEWDSSFVVNAKGF